MINEQAEQLYSTSIRSEIAQFLPSEYSKVLEIGCNVGNFRQSVDKPCEYWGVEPFKQAAEVAKTKMDKVFADFYDNVKNEIPNNYFDLIIANDVIEHLEQPWELLKSIKEKMTKNASLVLSIPNVRYFDNLKELLLEKDWRYRDVGILDITHLRFFTKKSIIRLLNENGFRIEKMQGINLRKVKKWKMPLLHLLRVIFGMDIIFLQFGMRVTKK
jgi:2-polyprenyl-3-methyl-5-hydroxy-6-metoxy-1,4-benzoquinol methylase